MLKVQTQIHAAKPVFQWLFLASLALSVSGCQSPFLNKPTQTETKKPTQVATKSGFGGTGKIQNSSHDNIANSSGFGGTGIIGTITEFGSILINGIKVEYPAHIEVRSNLNTADQLRIGQQVVLETVIDKSLPWTNIIEIFYPLAGRIEQVHQDYIVVDKHTVFISKSTRIMDNLQLSIGRYVAINGYPNLDTSWNATLISFNPEKKHFYKLLPDIKFSKHLRKLSIQSTQSQLKLWNEKFGGLPINLIMTGSTTTNLLIDADIHNGEITQYQLNQYKVQMNE